MPATVVAAGALAERRLLALLRGPQRLRGAAPEAQDERRPVPLDVRLLYDVARAGVGLELGECRLPDERGAHPTVGREQGAPLGAAAVVHPAVVERRVVVHPHPVLPAVQRLQPQLHDVRVTAGIGDVLLGQPVFPVLVLVHLGEPQAPRVRPAHRGRHVARGAVGERLTVGHQQLEAAHARRGQVGVEDLAGPPVLEGEPHVALPLPRGPEPGLVRLGPGLLLARLRRWRRRVGRRQVDECAGDGDSEGDGSGEQAQTHGGWGTRTAAPQTLDATGAVGEAGSDKESCDVLLVGATASPTATGRDVENARSRVSGTDPSRWG